MTGSREDKHLAKLLENEETNSVGKGGRERERTPHLQLTAGGQQALQGSPAALHPVGTVKTCQALGYQQWNNI